MKNKSLKFKFIAAMLIGTMALASFTIGCSKKSSTSKDASSPAEADKNENKNSTEDITFPDESETETETDKDGNVTVKITTYETDASGETVTDSEGNKVISETKSETFTKDEWENKQKETKPSNSGNNSSKDESKQAENTTTAASKPAEKPAVAPTKPAVKPTAAPTKAPTTAASKPVEKPAVKPTAAPAKPAEKPTAAPTKADPRKNWKTVTFTIKGNPEYDEKDEDWTFYSNGEWYFYIKEEHKNWGNTLEETTRFYGGETGIVLYKYIGNSEKVTIPTSIDGYPVAVAACPFLNNKTVKEIVIPKDLNGQFNLCNNSVITKVTVEANGNPDQPEFWHGDIFYNINNETIMVYCDEVLGNHFKEWKLKQDFAAYSYDGKTEYYRFHKIVAKK